MPKVNPQILVWAREAAGLTVKEAVKKLNINDARGQTAAERIAAIESGTQEPSRYLLVRMAKQYKRPLITFYLSAPPNKAETGHDFRSIPDNYSKADDFLINTLIRNISARQGMVRATLEDDAAEPLKFIGAYNISDGQVLLLKALQSTINFDRQQFRNQKSMIDAFGYLRDCVQDAGIFVLLVGNLGSYHSAIDVDFFRGFAIADNLAPFIIINDQDSHAAWSFTLVHELVHLFIGKTGISGAESNQEMESFCNQVSSEFLLPSTEIISYFKGNISTKDLIKKISEFALANKTSHSMIAYKLYKNNLIDFELWKSLNSTFREKWKKQKNSTQVKDVKGGPDYYIVKKHRLGAPFIEMVQNMINTGSLSTTKAGKILDVKPKNLQSLFDTLT